MSRWSKLSRSDRLVAMGLALVMFYGAALVGNGRSAEEFFPFFTWSLFSQVPPARTSDYSIRITRVAGKDLDPPLYFEQANRLLSTSSNPAAYDLLQQFGQAATDGRKADTAEARALFEDRFLRSLKQVDYELVHRKFDIRERYECQCFLSESVVGRFNTGP